LHSSKVGYSYLLAMILIWGASYSLTKIALDYASPVFIALFRVAVGSAILMGLTRKVLINEKIALAGLLNMGIELVLMNLSIAYSENPGLSAVLVYTQPIFLTLISATLLRKGVNLRSVVAMCFGFSGILLTAYSGLQEGIGLGNLLAILAGFSWAAGTVYYSINVELKDSLVATASMTLVSTPVVALALPLDFNFQLTGGSVALLLTITVLAQVIGYTLFFNSIKTLGPDTTSYALILTPIVALGFSYITLGKTLTPIDAAGSAITLVGVYFAMKSKT